MGFILQNKKIFSLIGLLMVLGFGIFFVFKNSGGDDYFEVQRGLLSDKILVTGVTKAASFADLSFDQTGRVEAVYAGVGQTVGPGDAVVVLDNDQAEATLASAKADLAYKQSSANQAKGDSFASEQTLRDSLRDAYTKTDDAIKNYADRFFSNPDTSPSFGISFEDGNKTVFFGSDSQSRELSLVSKKSQINVIMDEWKTEVASYQLAGRSELDGKASVVLDRMRTVLDFLDTLATAVNSFETSDLSYKTTVDGFKTSVATARSNVNTAIVNLTDANKEWNSARLAYEAPENLGEALPTALAEIKQAEAKVFEAEAALRKLSLVSPISGVVTKQEAKVGETVQAGEIIVSVLSPGAFEIEANVPEVQIGKVQIGNLVKVVFDAFPGEEFTGHVFYIEPSETIADGVVNYKIKVALDNNDERLKNGLTANLEIITMEKQNVLAIPKYAFFDKDGRTFVRKKEGNDVVEVEVSLGIEGSDGLIEVVVGLAEGDQIIMPSLEEGS